MRRIGYRLALMAATATAGCSANAAEADAVECGVALLIESANAKENGSQTLVDQLAPVIEWHRQRGGALRAELRSEERAMALMRRYQTDSKLRKTVAKGCVGEAYDDPAFARAGS